MKLLNTISSLLTEKVFAQMKDSLEIFYELDNTVHAIIYSKGRHINSGGYKIYDYDILKLLEKAKNQITTLIGTDEIHEGDTIVISEGSHPYLNVVIACEKYATAAWKLKIITVMNKEDFRAKKGDLVINVN
jgi:hypothetical protein